MTSTDTSCHPLHYHIILCQDKKGGIGKNHTLPWHIKQDLAYFKKITLDSIVIMGRHTWESLPIKPLPRRVHVVISSHDTLPTSQDSSMVYRVSNLKDLHALLSSATFRSRHAELSKNMCSSQSRIFCIGGAQLWHHMLFGDKEPTAQPLFHLDTLYMTRIHAEFDCDRHFPPLCQLLDSRHHLELLEASPRKKEGDLVFEHLVYQNRIEGVKKHGEYAYLDMLDQVIQQGHPSGDRTGIGTRFIFGTQMRFSLTDSFPLLTTKKTFLRGIIEECLWFMRGETDAKKLQAKRVHIWDGNSSRSFLDARGLDDYSEGDCGPIYGFAFRHFGAEYSHCNANYVGQGYDQIKEVLRLIREEPDSRRILISLWNPNDLHKVVLPPCHVLYQFRVHDGHLSCHLYQRSGDIGLGIPFNIASASLITYMLAHISGLQPGELIHSIGDAHVYNNHVDTLQQQLSRHPYPFPKLIIHDRGQTSPEDFVYEDFELRGYMSHPSLKMPMAV